VEVRHLRPSRDHVAGNPEVQVTVGRPTRECYGGVERIKAGDCAGAFFSQAASYLSVEGGSMQGKVEIAEASDTTGVV
jgi:hypothetical protein